MLDVQGLSVFYGRHRAVEDVSVKINEGEIVVMLGANGAGKSTLLSRIAGLAPANGSGAISLNGRNITHLSPHKIVDAGIALVPEGRGLFTELTARENLTLGAYPDRARSREAQNLERVYALFPKLAERRDQTVRTMSGGEQQMVAIGRAMMSAPDILMLDEPSLGLSPLLCRDLFRALAQVRDTGVGIFLVEQNAKQSLAIADRGYLLSNGHVTHEAAAQALARDPEVIRAYLGGEAPQRARKPAIDIAVPPTWRIGAADAEGLSEMAAAMAHRASAIRSAFVVASRRAAITPSAFVGRYDKNAATPEIPDLPVSHKYTLPRETVELAARAEGLAARAAGILSRHVRARRLSQPALPAPVRRAPAALEHTPLPALVDRRRQGLSAMAAELAEKAARRHAEETARRRTAARVQRNEPAAVLVKKTPAPVKTNGTAARSNGGAEAAHAAGSDATGRAFTRAQKLRPDDLAAMAARAHAEHIKARREAAGKPGAHRDADAISGKTGAGAPKKGH